MTTPTPHRTCRFEDHLACAQRLQAQAMWHAIAKAGCWLGERFRRWRARRVAYRTLAQLDHYQLRDMGLSRADLDAIADGSFERDSTRRHALASPATRPRRKL